MDPARMTKIVLDAESFKALASDTRLHILKALDARPLTVSELSRLLDLNKATVFEHLKQLTVAELAKREDDPGRKWVYYKLTWKGRNVLHPENAQIFIMLGMGALGVGGAILQTARILQLYLGSGPAQSESTAPEFAGDQRQPSAEADDAPRSAQGASSTTSAGGGTQADKASQTAPVENDMALRDGQPAPAADGDSYLDSLQSTDFLIVLFILSFLVLIALLVRSLYVGQRRERSKILALLDRLPADVNQAEERGV